MHDTTDPNDPLARPAYACVLCPPPRKVGGWRRAHEGYLTCDTCLDKVRSNLKEIGQRWMMLDARPGASGGDYGSRGAPGFGSRPPASVHIIAMRDVRSKGYEVAYDATVYTWDPNAGDLADDGQPEGAYTGRKDVWFGNDGRAHSEASNPVRSVPATLDAMGCMIAEERGVNPPPIRTVHGLVAWIDAHLDWVTRHELVIAVRDDIRDLVRQIRPVTGESGRKPIGLCPNTIIEGDKTRECKERLYAPMRGDEIVCFECERVWPREEWLRLGDLLAS